MTLGPDGVASLEGKVTLDPAVPSELSGTITATAVGQETEIDF